MSRTPRLEALAGYSDDLQRAFTLGEVVGAYLVRVRHLVDADSYGFYRTDGTPRLMNDPRPDERAFTDEYELYGRQDDPVLDFVFSRRLPMDCTRVGPPSRWERSGARSALAVAGYSQSMESPVIVSGTVFGTINFARRDRESQFSADDLDVAGQIGAVLGMATERALRADSALRRIALLEEALDQAREPVVITGPGGDREFANRAAQRSGENSDYGDYGDAVDAAIDDARKHFTNGGLRTRATGVAALGARPGLIVSTARSMVDSEATVTRVFARTGPDRAAAGHGILTARERTIVALVAEGLTTRQIASRAFITENTVKQHLKRVFVKAGVRNRAELIGHVWRNGGFGDSTAHLPPGA